MATILEAQPGARPGEDAAERREAGTWIVNVLLFCSTCIIVGLLWDISWHMSIGRDRLWSPPHVLEQIGASLAGLACGWLVLRTTFAGSTAERGRTVRFWGFRGPLGGWVAIWGSFAMIFSVPFDDWWHNAYGLDVQILSPPHVVLLCGMIAIQLGAMLLALGVQNRATGQDQRRFALAVAYAAGALIAMVVTASSEYTLLPNLWHSSLMVIVAAATLPLFLVPIARAGRLRWPATTTAALFMAVFLIPQWVLVQFPATPRLNPIVTPLTHMAAFGFPLVLIVPALAMDLVMRRGSKLGDWKLAGVIGVLFVATLVAVHWPLANFLVGSPLAQNEFFLADHWPYATSVATVRGAWFNLDGARGVWSFTEYLAGLGIAVLLGILATRVGLAWGSWMQRVKR